MGEMGCRDSRPEERGSCLARHLQHRRGSGSCLRQRSRQNPREEGEGQFPQRRCRRLLLLEKSPDR
ncbi:unnamed protein product [Linum tenue]|uniref:Uncharacterized protein n=1 Tax=Linum tenue TaxID=586396 RepID=A0AAV0HR51_9ROSI|nr:unnamed protein product [Linum tenue]